jgi:hypothetical protein
MQFSTSASHSLTSFKRIPPGWQNSGPSYGSGDIKTLKFEGRYFLEEIVGTGVYMNLYHPIK